MRVKALVVLPIVVVLFIAQAWMQNVRIYPFWKENYAPRGDADLSALSPDQMLLALAGFREMVAGLLWLTLLRERHIRTLQTQLDESHTVMAEQHLALCLAAGDDPEEVAVRMAAKIRNEATH